MVDFMANSSAEKLDGDNRAKAKPDNADALIHQLDRPAPGVSAGGDGPGLPEAVFNRLVQRMDQRPDNSKLNMSVPELQAVKTIEQSILKGDTKRLEQALQGFGKKPVDAEDIMNAVVSDLDAVGVQASWDYSTKVKGKPYDPSYYEQGKEDVGNFSVYRNSGDKISSVTFNTEGKVTAVDSRLQDGAPAQGGSGKADPVATLAALRAQWQKGW